MYVNMHAVRMCINVDESGGEDEAEAPGGAVCPAAGYHK